MTSHPSTFEPAGILFGAAYYAEYQPTDRVSEDLDLMAAAGFTVIRVGESVWSTWEPSEGVFDLDWLAPVLDGAHERGIGVILGTPTYAAPPWLQKRHPEIAAEIAPGQRVPWGARQEIDFTQPAFLHYAERVIRAVVGRYAAHPAVIGFQLDNEPGLHLFHNASTFGRFVDQLKDTYVDVETLNREWGLTYWSHRIAEWSELWTPEGNTLPQYDLAWRRFQADLTTEFIHWQARIVSEYRRQGQFLTTCIAYPRPAVEDAALTRGLDVTAGNPYYGTQDHLDKRLELEPLAPWTTTGVWGLFRQADRMYSSKQSRFLVTETNAQSIGGADINLPPYPGQLKQAALALVSRGAAMIEYWHWHTIHYGTETYWGGILPHSLRPGRVYREIAELGHAFQALGGALDGYTPDADVVLLYSSASKWAFEFSPPLQTEAGEPDRESYTRIFDAFYRGVVDSGAQARIVHASLLQEQDPSAFAEQHPIFVVPAFYVAADQDLEFLRDYAEAGGHLLLGIRTGYGDAEARARVEVAPATFAEHARVWYDEYSNLREPVPLETSDSPFRLSPPARATLWADGLVAEEADVLATYVHPELRRHAAITTTEYGRGRITYVGTVPNPALAADLIRWAVPAPVAGNWMLDDDSPVTISSGVAASGARIWFVHNWSSETAGVRVPADVSDLISGRSSAAGTDLSLEPWSCIVLTGD